MRRIIYSFVLLIACVFVGQAQISNWQGVLRDSDNKPMVDQNVRLRFTINQAGSSVYSETHQAQTSGLGLINVQVCKGTAGSGSCTDIDPTKGTLSLKVEVDETGGTNFKDFGTSEISQSFYSQWANRVVNDKVDDADANATNEIQTISMDGKMITLSHNGGSIEIETGGADADADSTNELQMISIQGNLLTISDGNTITIPRSGSDADFDPSNELQTLRRNGDEIELWQQQRKFGSVTDTNEDADADPANEIQTLSFDQTVLTLSDGGSVDLVSLQKPASEVWKTTNNSVFWDHNAGSKYEFGLSKFDLFFSANAEKQFKVGSNTLRESFKSRFPDYRGGEFESSLFMAEHPGIIKNYHNMFGDTMWSLQSTFVGTDHYRSDLFLESTVDGSHIKSMVLSAYGYGSVFLLNPANPTQVIAGMYVDANGVPTLAAQVKNFIEPDPLNKDQEIWYACIEGPEAAIYERGTTNLVDGEVTVDFSQHFKSLAGTKYTIILTPMSADSKGLAVVKKTKSGFEVKELFKGEGSYSFDWEVKAVRKGFENYEVIRKKGDTTMEKLTGSGMNFKK